MDEKFLLFLNDILAESQGFVLELDKYLTAMGSKRTVKEAKSGFMHRVLESIQISCLTYRKI